jgi:hypothetical protein
MSRLAVEDFQIVACVVLSGMLRITAAGREKNPGVNENHYYRSVLYVPPGGLSIRVIVH